MPSKNTIKIFDTEQMWHIYNRGNDKRLIFLDEQDYKVFLSYLKCALLTEVDEESAKELSKHLSIERVRRLRLHNEVELVSYCLMPNHFHLLLYQTTQDGISKLMRSIMTGYVAYFNYRHERSGRLFQGVYKGSRINSDSYWTHISRYIHLNPKEFRNYEYSSYKYYTGQVSVPGWLKIEKVMGMFKTTSEYSNFCVEYEDEKRETAILKEVTADS